MDRCGRDLDAVPDFSWNVELSPGETQRLCFARLFYQRPGDQRLQNNKDPAKISCWISWHIVHDPEPRSQINFNVAELCYNEITLFNWLKLAN